MHAAPTTDHAGGARDRILFVRRADARGHSVKTAGTGVGPATELPAAGHGGALAEGALAALVATGVTSVTLVRAFHPYPDPQRADVIWVLGVDREETWTMRLGTALLCLAPGGRLLLELCGTCADRATSLTVQLRHHSLTTVRVEALRPGVVLVRGDAPAHQQRAA